MNSIKVSSFSEEFQKIYVNYKKCKDSFETKETSIDKINKFINLKNQLKLSALSSDDILLLPKSNEVENLNKQEMRIAEKNKVLEDKFKKTIKKANKQTNMHIIEKVINTHFNGKMSNDFNRIKQEIKEKFNTLNKNKDFDENLRSKMSLKNVKFEDETKT